MLIIYIKCEVHDIIGNFSKDVVLCGWTTSLHVFRQEHALISFSISTNIVELHKLYESYF